MAQQTYVYGRGVGTGGGSGGGLRFRTPRDTFSAATIAAARTARDTAITDVADELAEFDADPSLVIELINTGTTPDTVVYESRRSGAWVVVTNIVSVTGPRGPSGADATDQQVTNAVQTGVKPFARVGGPQVPDSEIPSAIMRDSEFTTSAVLSLLSLSATELNDLLTGASLSNGVLTFTQNDGTDIDIPIGGGGGGGSADGVITGASIDSGGMTLTLTRSVGDDIAVSIPSVLRETGLSEEQVNALIAAAEADDLDASDVAAQINTALVGYARLSGATFTGAAKGIDPDANEDFATKEYVDTTVAAGGEPTDSDDIYFGLSDDRMPESAEATIPATDGSAVIEAFTDKYMLIFRLATEADIVSVTFSDDISQTNQLGVFTKHANTVIPQGETQPFNVWVSDELLTQPDRATATVR